MNKLTIELEKDLANIASKHKLTYFQLLDLIYEAIEEQDIKQDVIYRLESWYDKEEEDITEDLVERIYQRFLHCEDSDHSLWENIDNAIRWILEGYDQN